jgi:hypothetical protein
MEGVQVPDQFTLYFSGPGAQRRECRVAWRLGYELGAEFIDTTAEGFARGVALSYAALSKDLGR